MIHRTEHVRNNVNPVKNLIFSSIFVLCDLIFMNHTIDLMLFCRDDSFLFLKMHFLMNHLSRKWLLKTLFQVWLKFVLPVRTLCNGDIDRNIKFECYDHNKSGNHSLIGEFFTTARQLMAGPGNGNTYLCINPKKQVRDIIYWNLLSFEIEQYSRSVMRRGMEMVKIQNYFRISVLFTIAKFSHKMSQKI